MPYLLSIIYLRRALAQRAFIGYLPWALLAAGKAFSLLLLAAQVIAQLAAIDLVRIHV